jgi:hypothetical protein
VLRTTDANIEWHERFVERKLVAAGSRTVPLLYKSSSVTVSFFLNA